MAKRTPVMTEKNREHRKTFKKIFENISYKYSKHTVWRDFIYLCASALSQTLDFRQSREDEYIRIINSYEKETQDIFVEIFGELILAFKEEDFADILGEIYSELNLTNAKAGQFFTPYHICKLMAAITSSSERLSIEIEQKGYVSVNDPCCGAGALLIAFADQCREYKIDYEKSVLFVAQDIDPVVALMCYIQMTLLNMPGYVIIGNVLTNTIPDVNSIWFTNAYFCNEFHLRTQKTVEDMSDIIETETVQTVIPNIDIMLRENDSGQFTFDFVS
jgi:type I restriction-modification system DNA methylase subunit